MLKWLATMHKEWLLLVRDRAGLLLLFAMPAALVVVITLVQDNIMRQNGGFRISGIIVDRDGGQAARILMRELETTEGVSFRPETDPDEAAARRLVSQGSAEFYAAVPPGLTDAVSFAVKDRIDRMMAGESYALQPDSLPQITIYFDPMVQAVYRTAVNGALRRAVIAMQAEYSLKYLGEALESNFRRNLSGASGAMAPHLPERLVPELQGDLLHDPLVRVAAQSTGTAGYNRLPTAVEQNVPAWALFGMFFIVVPLSGSLIRERREGIFARLMIMPVSKTSLILGKLGAYVGVCMVQFVCIVAVGRWLLPLLGTDSLVLTRSWTLLLVALCCALAATGYGIMLGALSRTNEQAAILGPVTVVIAAALGGIMVPVFAMPAAMQTISRVSPLAWGHEAFMAVLVRDGSLSAVGGHLALLLLFFAVTLTASLIGLNRRSSLNS
jgi:ABC-2 type transport system permease protein